MAFGPLQRDEPLSIRRLGLARADRSGWSRPNGCMPKAASPSLLERRLAVEFLRPPLIRQESFVMPDRGEGERLRVLITDRGLQDRAGRPDDPESDVRSVSSTPRRSAVTPLRQRAGRGSVPSRRRAPQRMVSAISSPGSSTRRPSSGQTSSGSFSAALAWLTGSATNRPPSTGE